MQQFSDTPLAPTKRRTGRQTLQPVYATGPIVSLVTGHDGRILAELADERTGKTYLAVSDSAMVETGGHYRLTGSATSAELLGTFRIIVHSALWQKIE